MSAALKNRAFTSSRALERVHANKVVALLPRRHMRPRFEQGCLVWWEGRRYCVDGMDLVGSTWVAELIRPEDFTHALRVSYAVPTAELLHCDEL